MPALTSGNDTYTQDGVAESTWVNSLAGDDTITISNSGLKADIYYTGLGNDILQITNATSTNSNYAWINLQDGNDTITVTGSTINARIKLLGGSDTVNITDSYVSNNIDYGFSDPLTGAGNNVTIENSTIGGIIHLENYIDVHPEWGPNMNAAFASGTDYLTVSNSSIAKWITGGDGDDQFEFHNASVGEQIILEAGSDTMVIDGLTMLNGSQINAGNGTGLNGNQTDQDTFIVTENQNSNLTLNGGNGGSTDYDTLKLTALIKAGKLSESNIVTTSSSDAGAVNGTATLNDGTVISFSNIESLVLICFTEGMMIETDQGEVAVENLQIGDRLRTYDSGFKPIRFIYSTTISASGNNAPVVFEKHAIGNDRELVVSRKHRMYTGTLDETLLPLYAQNQRDSLIHAEKLVNGTTIRLRNDGTPVTYYHIMLDQHELLYCHGTISESWHPVRRNLRRFNHDPETRNEMLRLFPELAQKNVTNTPAVRPLTDPSNFKPFLAPK